MNLGDIYKELGNLEQAHACTLKSQSSKLTTPTHFLNYNIYSKKDLSGLKSIARRAVDKNKKLLNDLNYIEAISSLGKSLPSQSFLRGINQPMNPQSA